MVDEESAAIGGMLRVRRSKFYGAVPEFLLEDGRLGPAARVAAAWLEMRPDGWIMIVEVARRRLGFGRDRWRSAMTELEKAGYLSRTRTQASNGRWRWQWEYSTEAGFPDIGKPDNRESRDRESQPQLHIETV